MTEFKFTDDSFPFNLKDLKTKMFELGKFISDNAAEDSGYKDGIKTTSYDFEYDYMRWSGWDGDDECFRQLYYKDKVVFSYYDCYGNGTVKFDDAELLKNIYKLRVKKG